MNALSGHIEGDEHVIAVRVYYEDTDAAGVVYYANYLKFAERARTEMLRLVGLNQSDVVSHHRIGFAVRGCTLDYRRPARLDDLLEVRSRLTELRGATLRADQLITCRSSELARVQARVACVGSDGSPVRIPTAIREALAPYFQRKVQV